MTKLRSDGERHCGRDLDRGEAVSLHHVINWDRVSFRVSLLVVDERGAASLGVPHVAACPDLMPGVQLNRRDLGARGKQPDHDAMQIRRMKDPGNQQNIDTSLSRMIGHRAYIRVHHCFRPLIDPPRPVEPEGVNVDPLNEIRASLGKLHQAPGGRGLANTRGSAQEHYAHRPRLHGSNDRNHQLNGAGPSTSGTACSGRVQKLSLRSPNPFKLRKRDQNTGTRAGGTRSIVLPPVFEVGQRDR